MKILCSTRLSWNDLSGSEQMAVSKAKELIEIEGENVWDAAYSACNQISEANSYSEYEGEDFYQDEPDFDKVVEYLEGDSTINSSVESKLVEKPYIVTYMWDDGSIEDGPIIHHGEDLVYAISEDDACRRWEDECNVEYDGCSAREATREEVIEYEQEMDKQSKIQEFLDDEYDNSAKVESSIDASDRWWSKYYDIASESDLLSLTNLPNMDEFNAFGNCEDLEGYDAKHIAWLIAKDEYMYELGQDGYDLIELCEEGGEEILGYIQGDRLYDATDWILDIVNNEED